MILLLTTAAVCENEAELASTELTVDKKNDVMPSCWADQDTNFCSR